MILCPINASGLRMHICTNVSQASCNENYDLNGPNGLNVLITQFRSYVPQAGQ